MNPLCEYNLNISKSYAPQVEKILKDCALSGIKVSTASNYDDVNKAIDFNISVIGGSVGSRVMIGLNGFNEYHQFTLRTSLPSGLKTEIMKVWEGNPRWYLYCWSDKGIITHWIFVDMDLFRKRAISIPDDVHVKNYDGSTFSGWNIANLYGYYCFSIMSEPVREYLKSSGGIPHFFCDFDDDNYGKIRNI